jgi:asparagine synthase (glutamine-hydrolysing)
MCGICGVWNRDGVPVGDSQIENMSSMLVHRGPDGKGAWLDGEIGLGHRRLEIIDPGPGGHQPMATPERDLWVVFNGEIHNHLELRAELEGQGETFRSSCDTEVLLAAYREWGLDCFPRFNGMWAVALWDVRKQRLVLSRDHFGIKPLYYSWSGNRVAFASEPKAILAAFPEERRVNGEYVRWFLAGASPDWGQETFFAGIKSVEQGTSLVLQRDGSAATRRYWQVEPDRYTVQDPEEEFRELLTDAVRLRLRSDVPVGACLSGGLDSSAIVRLARAQLEMPMECFTMRVRQPGYDESEFAAAVTEGSDDYRHHWIEPGPEGLLETLGRIVWHHDGPTPMRARYGKWHVFEEAGRHVKVVVDGQGADELLGGYGRFYFPHLLDSVRRGPRALVGEARDVARLWSWGGIARSPISPLVRRSSKQLWPSSRLVRKAPGESREAPAESLYESWLCHDADRPFESHLDNALWGELRYHLPELLHGEDALGMAHSVEARPAFLDRRLVEFCFSLSGSEKIRGGWRKSLLRRAMEGVLPPVVQWRRDKKGYPTPLNAWMLGAENYPAIRELMLGADARAGEFVRRRSLAQLLERHRAAPYQKSGYASELLFRCVTLELWLRQLNEQA